MNRTSIARATSSLTAKLLVVIVLYATVLVASFSAVGAIVNASLDNAFPSIESIFEHQDALEEDRFDILANRSLSRCEIAIFDASGQRLFASSRAAASDLSYSFAKDMEEFDSFEAENLAGLSSCIVEKREYRTVDGQERTLLTVSPILDEGAYAQVVNESHRLWLTLIPIAAIAIIAAGTFIVSIVKRAVKPLNNIISSFKDGARGAAVDGARICTELLPIHDNFVELMGLLQSEKENKQQLMADISHDLKTPLTVIRGYSQALRDGRVPASKQGAYLSVISERAVSASLLLDDLFAYSKMEHPAYQVAKERVDVLKMVRQAAAAFVIESEKEGFKLELDVPDVVVEALVDARLLNRALSNLFDNAIKHCGGEGLVRIECDVVDENVTISIANTGHGIPPELKGRIFDPFVTGDAARTTGKGTGLGLAITRTCVELNGGSIYMTSHSPEPFSTTFVCKFPVAR